MGQIDGDGTLALVEAFPVQAASLRVRAAIDENRDRREGIDSDDFGTELARCNAQDGAATKEAASMTRTPAADDSS